MLIKCLILNAILKSLKLSEIGQFQKLDARPLKRIQKSQKVYSHFHRNTPKKKYLFGLKGEDLHIPKKFDRF